MTSKASLRLASIMQPILMMRLLQRGLVVAMQAVCYLRPTRENIARLRRELRDPRYGEYNLCARSPHFRPTL